MWSENPKHLADTQDTCLAVDVRTLGTYLLGTGLLLWCEQAVECALAQKSWRSWRRSRTNRSSKAKQCECKACEQPGLGQHLINHYIELRCCKFETSAVHLVEAASLWIHRAPCAPSTAQPL